MRRDPLDLDTFRDIVQSLGGDLAIVRVATQPFGRKRRPQMTVTFGARVLRTTAPTVRECCERLLPFVEIAAARMEARS